MEILGHYYIANQIVLLFEINDYSSKNIYLMFPNYMHCHEWCYQNLWSQYCCEPRMKMIKIHALSDWFIHYGDTTANKYKIGWAYSKMDRTIKATDKAFMHLSRLGYLDYKKGDYRFFSERKAFNIFHSIIEYAIELHFIDEFTKDNIECIIKSHQEIQRESSKLLTFMTEHKITSDQTECVIKKSIEKTSITANENNILLFPINSMLEKGNVVSNEETRMIILELMQDVCEKVSKSEALAALDYVTSKVINFEQYYDGDFNAKSNYINS